MKSRKLKSSEIQNVVISIPRGVGLKLEKFARQRGESLPSVVSFFLNKGLDEPIFIKEDEILDAFFANSFTL